MSELIIVDDVVASDSFPSLWEALKGELSISYKISASEQSSADFSQLPANEQISIISAKVSEFAIRIKDDIARGITRNIAALERGSDALMQQVVSVVEQVVDTANTESLWSIVGLGGIFNSDMMRRIAANPNANIEILEQILLHIKDVSIFEQLLAREDVLNTDEMKVDFATSMLRVMTDFQGKLSYEELSSLDGAVERTKEALSSLHHNLISNSTLTRTGMIDGDLLRISVNEFTSTPTLNTLMGQCLYYGHIDMVTDVCNHGNASSGIIQMAAGYIQKSQDISLSLVRTLILSPHSNEDVILSLIANESISLEFKQDTIQQSKFKSNSNIVIALVSAKRSQSVKKSNATAVQLDTAANKEEKKESLTLKKGLPNTQTKQAVATLAKQNRNEKLIEGHAQKIAEFFIGGHENEFNLAHQYLTGKRMLKFAIRIVMESRIVLKHYLESRNGRKALEELLKVCGCANLPVVPTDAGKKIAKKILDNTAILTMATFEKLIILPTFLLSCIGGADIAAYAGNLDALKPIIENLPDDVARDELVNKLTPSGTTPLYMACENGNESVVNFMINVGADCRVCNLDGANSAHVLARKDNAKILKVIVESLPDDSHSEFVNKQITSSGATPLYLACHFNHQDTVRYLLSIGADYKIHGANGLNPMHAAAQSGNLEILKLLLESLPSRERYEAVNKQTEGGFFLFHIACAKNDKVTVKYLLSLGVDYNLCSTAGWGGVHIAAHKGCLETLVFLVENLPDEDARRKFVNKKMLDDGPTPLYLACKINNEAIVRYLLSVGADCRICGSNGLNPMHSAAQNGSTKSVELLMKSFPDGDSARSNLVNMQALDGATALFFACQKGHLNVVEYLLGYNEISLVSIIRSYDECIEFGIENGPVIERKMRGYLENKGILIGCKTKLAVSPLEVAYIMGHSDIVKLLSVYINGNSDKVEVQTIEAECTIQIHRDFNSMMYSSILHKTFQLAYEKGQKEKRDVDGYGEKSLVLYNSAMAMM
ncbi:MAG: hypothetical protein HON32_05980 [Francisellaceae bacterium]|nr:hypothetical protein [Francisellaceae bacterium]MBT6539933.1 hypothetical protein [Francisellaceae bacterium]